jgi:radical SAM superfamily enzyme YgiQ (UPF0313 family)
MRVMELTGEHAARTQSGWSLRRHLFRIVIPAYPAFNIYSAIARKTSAFGPIYIATVASQMAGWNVEVIDENNYRRPGPKDRSGRPDHGVLQKIRHADFVGFYGGLTSTIPRVYELAALYKSQGVTTIAGGQHFVQGNIKEALDNGVDFVVIGEAEETIMELLDVLGSNRDPATIAGIAFVRDGRAIQTADRAPLIDSDKLRLPDFSLLRYTKIKVYPVSWVRGCAMSCEFCTVKGKARYPAPEYVLEQIAALLERYNARHFFMVDDLFGQNRATTLYLCRLLEEYQQAIGIRIDITVQIRLDKARDTELLQSMRRAGINKVAIGFESPIPEELAAMKKRVNPEEMLGMTRLFHEAGFLVHGMFIFGYPLPYRASLSMTARERVRRFRAFIRRARIDTVQILLPVPLPGTELTGRLAAQNRIFPIDCVGWEYYDGNFPLFHPDEPLTPEEMQVAIRTIMGRFYRFRHVLMIPLNILAFPAIVFSLHNISLGWRKWYRLWRNELLRFTGWIVMRKWTSELRKGDFSRKLAQAKERFLRQ